VKQVVLSRSGVEVRDVPSPAVQPGTVLVRTEASCISTGTELSGVRSSNTPLWKKALEKPEQVKRFARLVMDEGIGKARSLLEGKLAEANPVGYSAVGRVVALGEGVSDLAANERVACAGAQSAHHAEILCVPRNLCVAVPDGVSNEDASTVSLGAIALQGVRRLEPTLGEAIVVIGLGLIGQLTVQLLRTAGCRTIGLDLDPRRIADAVAGGLDIGIDPAREASVEQVHRLTDGNGADGVIVTAASPSDDIISTAFRMCRRKARVVLVGDVGLDLKREDVYAKELDLRMSTSYGPGRYDRLYEEQGLDYPVAYVRWTENRNMAEYLRQIARGHVDLGRLKRAVFPLERAPEAYRALADKASAPLVAFLDYGAAEKSLDRIVASAPIRPRQGRIRLALVGAGAFGRTMHVPLIQGMKEAFDLAAVVSRRGLQASTLAQQVGAAVSATDLSDVLQRDAADAVLITTRHDSHAALTLQALNAGKHVLVEKPLCISREQLVQIEARIAELGDGCPVLLTGFNRRFAPHAVKTKDLLAKRSNPFVLTYRVNAGYLPPDHWVHGAEGGGRNIGEACHFYDLIGFFAGAPVKTVDARGIAPSSGHYLRSDNFSATLTFEDGSLATVIYTALGYADEPKEQIEIYCDGRIIRIVDFRDFSVAGAGATSAKLSVADKGHSAQLQAFAKAVSGKSGWPMSWTEQKQAMQIAFDVEDAIQGRQA
jgi:predicted dehydrogenase/threonine dehydrogenase-like Zn-dependent dehydrogenase